MIDDILLFINLIKTNSFNKCSLMNNLSTSTLSRRIKALEIELGYQLLQRDSHRMLLTEQGKELYKEFENYENKLFAELNLIEKEKQSISGRLYVSLPSSLSYYYVLPYLGEFLQQYPELELFIDHNSYEFNINNKSYDLAITNYRPLQQTQKIKQIANEKIVLVCTPQYREKYGLPNDLFSLNHHITIGKVSQNQKIVSSISFFHEGSDELIQLPIKSRIYVNNFVEVECVISNHHVIAGMPFGSVEQRILEQSLIRVLPDYHVGIMNYYLSRTIDENDPRYKVFMMFIHKCLEPIKHITVSNQRQYFHS